MRSQLRAKRALLISVAKKQTDTEDFIVLRITKVNGKEMLR